MNSSIIQSRDHGFWLPVGPLVLIMQMMSPVKFIKNSMLRKIWVILGNILKIMFMISHGEQLHIQHPLKDQVKTSQEFSLLTIQTLKVIKEPSTDGDNKFIYTSQKISSKPRRKCLTLEIVL